MDSFKNNVFTAFDEGIKLLLLVNYWSTLQIYYKYNVP